MVDVPLSHTEAVERDAVSQNGAGTGAGGQEAAWEKAMSLSAESANAPEALHALCLRVGESDSHAPLPGSPGIK